MKDIMLQVVLEDKNKIKDMDETKLAIKENNTRPGGITDRTW